MGSLIDDGRWFVTDHAIERMTEMKVSDDDVLTTLHEPTLTCPGGIAHPPGRVLYQRGDLVIVTDGNARIYTVLWHRKEGR